MLNVCQDTKTLGAVDGSLCDSCDLNLRRQSCLIQLALRQEMESQSSMTAKRHLVVQCGEWRPLGKEIDLGHDIRPDLRRHGVRDLCRECGLDQRGACQTRAAIDEIEYRADASGIAVEAMVYSCYPKPDPREMLHQIGHAAKP